MVATMPMRFKDRTHAGAELAQRLAAYRGRNDAIVIALPRGGVPVGYALAKALQLPLDILLVRKLGVPGHEELAMGAIASGGLRVLNDDVLALLNIDADVVHMVARRELAEIERREALYRAGAPAVDPEGKTAIVVDDGLATGSTMRVAIKALRHRNPAKIVVAVPVAPPGACEEMRREADEVICLSMPPLFEAVSLWYDDFAQTSDAEVSGLLSEARSGPTKPVAGRTP